MFKAPFKKVLIANRGEIVIRIARAATELGIRTVGIYSYEDRFSVHRFKTDETYQLGKIGFPLSAYLEAKPIVDLAKKLGVEAIHPGYGFLSENEEFSILCQKAGIKFIGPSSEVLSFFGDKTKAREVANKAGLRPIPGSDKALESITQAERLADKLGYPVTLKAVSGGGGKGIRLIEKKEDLKHAFERAESEALTSFGSSSLYLEKTIVSPRHIEVQILGDSHGNIVHLFERDCSIQRRNQKVVEIAPAVGVSEKIRRSLCEQAVKLARFVNYEGLGTVEFLVDQKGEIYFLEVNPRIQVEHTVTEMVTGIDLVQSSILVASGKSITDPKVGIRDQSSIKIKGTAIQCRVTTEDPQNDFAPDTGRIIAYRPAAGFGIRFDEGLGTSGAIVTPHFDSLLVKITAWGLSLDAAASKMHRSLIEFRIRGVKHNIPLLKNVVTNPDFLKQKLSTNFLKEHPDIFKYPTPKDRATKLLKYIAEVTINNTHGLSLKNKGSLKDSPNVDSDSFSIRHRGNKGLTAKQVFDKNGTQGLTKWIYAQGKKLLLTDTTMRDAHQSLFATRLRTRDMLKIAPFYSKWAESFFSLEVWGGATFDTSLRFLKEDPWERLATIRELIPNILLQMLIRGDNAVGYTNYPSWVVRDFIKETAHSGLDVFRIFDCFNQPQKMKVALEEVKKQGKIAEVSLCYTGDISDHSRTKYDINYYLKVAKELQIMGADILCIKDMAGLLKPKAAKILITSLLDEIDLPIHFHTHDTSGLQVSSAIAAAESGCHIIDGAVSSMSGLTSQPSLNAIVAALEGTENDPSLSLEVLDELARYWGQVREMYCSFDPGVKATSTEVYVHEIPGGQYSNLYDQALRVGLTADEFYDLTKRYKEVNEVLGDIVKVTPSSKVVGDLALLLHKKEITAKDWLDNELKLDYPDSLISLVSGRLGAPEGGVPDKVKKLVLSNQLSTTNSLGHVDSEESSQSIITEVEKKINRLPTYQDLLSWRLYPKVFEEYCSHINKYGRMSEIPTPVFFFGLEQGEEIAVEIEQGKTLFIKLEGISDADKDGKRSVFFKLNGFPRDIEILDKSFENAGLKRLKGDNNNKGHIIATMPGKVLDLKVKTGQTVKSGELLLVTEAMKMEYSVTAKISGEITAIHVKKDDVIEADDLLVEMS